LEKGICQDSSCIENGKLILITIRDYLDNTNKNSTTKLKEILKLDNEYELFEGNEKNESKLMSVLGNETRIKILKELSKGSNYYTKLERITGLRGGHFSFHLRELKNANFIKTSKDDKSYQITAKGLKALKMIFELSKE
jgi:DNA-binding transcriptional ArsR family regulator